MSQTTPVSRENLDVNRISEPKNLQEFGKMLEQQKSKISAADYEAIQIRLNAQKSVIEQNANRVGFEKQLAPVYLKEQISSLESALRKEEAATIAADTLKIQAPVIQAAAKGDTRAVQALDTVAIATMPIDAKKTQDTEVIVATTKKEVKENKEAVVKTSIENTLKIQAESLVRYFETVSPLLKGTPIIADMKENLHHTNIRSLVAHLAR